MLTTLREDFKEYRSNRQEIRELKMQLENMDCLSDTVNGSDDEWPYIQHAITVKGRNAAEDAISKAPNGMTRRMLRLRYKQGLKWADVAAQMGEDVTEGSLKQRDREFFKDK